MFSGAILAAILNFDRHLEFKIVQFNWNYILASKNCPFQKKMTHYKGLKCAILGEKWKKNTKMAAILKKWPIPKFEKWIIVFEGFWHQDIDLWKFSSCKQKLNSLWSWGVSGGPFSNFAPPPPRAWMGGKNDRCSGGFLLGLADGSVPRDPILIHYFWVIER